jgi:hypothetical protein
VHGLGHQDQHVQRVLVSGDRLRHKAVVEGEDQGGSDDLLDAEDARALAEAVLYFRAGGDLDDGVEDWRGASVFFLIEKKGKRDVRLRRERKEKKEEAENFLAEQPS